MEFRQLAIAGAFEITPVQHGDPRGVFLEAFKAPAFEAAVGHRFNLAQVNCSTSAAGTVRGIHFAQVPPGQAKYVTCPRGALLDVIVDIRVGSPTFGVHDTVLLDDDSRRAVYLPEGLGHAFMALEDMTTAMYFQTSGFNPSREFGVHPLDPTIGIEWPTLDRAGNPIRPLLSAKDEAAPTLDEAARMGLLPIYDDVIAYVDTLD
jgi:dTDP-4-dehydrorhamnose 3,5-epimerase